MALRFETSRIHSILFSILIASIPVQLGLHFWPDWTTVLGRNIDYLSPTVYATDLLIISIILLRLRDSFPRLHSRYVLFAVGGLIVSVINILAATRMPVSLYSFITLGKFVMLVWYVLSTKPDIRSLLVPWSISIFWVSLIAIIQFILQHSIGGIFWFAGERYFTTGTPGIAQVPLCLPYFSGCPLLVRAYGTFPHPNVLAGFLAVSIPIIFFITKKPGIGINSIWKSMVMIIGITALVLAFSRSAFMVFILLSVYFRWKLSLKGPMTVMLIIAAIGISYVSVAMIPTGESISVRQLLFGSAMEMWKHHPLAGVGLGNFIPSLPSFLPSKFIYYLQPVHSIYMLLLSEVGLIGVLFVLITIVFTWKKRYASSLFFAPLLAYLALGLIDHYPLTLHQGRLLLALLIGLTLRE